MSQSPIPNTSKPSIDVDTDIDQELEDLTTPRLLAQIDILVEKHFSIFKNLDKKQQSIALQPYITEYKSYKGIHEPYILEYLKLDRNQDLGTIALNLELKVSKNILYSFYLCWVEDIFEKGKILKQKYVYLSFDLENEIAVPMFDVGSLLARGIAKAKGKTKTMPKSKKKIGIWDYSTNQFSIFANDFEQILEKHSSNH